MRTFRILLSAWVALTATAALAQPPSIPAVKLPKPPTIDGFVNPEEWDGAATVTELRDSVTTRPAPFETTIYLAYDDEAIYVAFVGRDPEPEKIVAREVRPGADLGNDDNYMFVINPFGNKSWDGISRFQVNALNTQSDSIAGGRTGKREWRGTWTSATRLLPDGWSAEMRIPWSILDYPAREVQNMDVNFWRYQARSRIDAGWTNAVPNPQPENIGTWEGVRVNRRASGRRAEFLGYAAPEIDRGEASFRAGLDVRLRLNHDLTGLVSLNPDFKNIESQIEGIEFSRTERFRGETRPFFTEGSGFFSLMPWFSFGQMFYSQRIADFDMGAKVFGRLTPDDQIGALATVEAGEETVGVARYRRQLGPGGFGSVFATVYDRSGEQNTSYGFNGSQRFGLWTVDAQLAMERDQGTTPDSAGAVALSYSAPRIFGVVRGMWIEPDFAPPLGFIPWTDRRGVYIYIDHGGEFRNGTVRDASLSFDVSSFRTFDDDQQEEGFGGNAGFTTRNDIGLRVGHTQKRFFGELENIWNLSATVNASNRFRQTSLYVESGVREGQISRFASVSGSYRLFRKLDLGFSRSVLEFGGTATQTVMTAAYEIDPLRAISGRAVVRDGKWNAYVAYRRAGGHGIEYFVILGDPNANSTRQRLSVKVVWAF